MRVRIALCASVVCGFWALGALGTMAAACGAHMSFTRTGDASRGAQPRGPAQVELFTKGGPARPHEELGVIETQPSSSTGNDAKLVENMREYAGELGCDALVISVDTEPSHTPKLYRGVCFAYTAPPLMQPPPTAAGGGVPSTCIAGSAQPCYGSGGCRGNQVCSADGKSFTACDCAAPSSK